MFVVADMGSTKTDWGFINKNKEKYTLTTKGFNPYFYTTEEIIVLLKPEFENIAIDLDAVENIYFYGSGCSDRREEVVKKALSTFFPKAHIFVFHDLLGSARAVCGNTKGIACILGTGSNSAHYDGTKIVAHNPSLGFLLGDEGSGSDLGRELIKYYMYGALPTDLEESFEKRYGVQKQSLLESIYTNQHPNTYCASFSPFLSENKAAPIITELIEKRINEFFKNHICIYKGYQDVPVNFVGSVAHYFEENIQRVAQNYGVTVGIIIKNPLEALVVFHQK